MIAIKSPEPEATCYDLPKSARQGSIRDKLTPGRSSASSDSPEQKALKDKGAYEALSGTKR
jgi:hypothetical protein